MIFAAILAGGTGTRFGAGVPKQFFKINNKPLLVYCIEPFLKVDLLDKIIVSSPKHYLNDTQKIIDEYFDDDKLVVIEGGKTRNGTILNSIDYAIKSGANDDSVMVTHDGARIFVTPKLIEYSIKYANEFGAASPVVPAVDVIFQSKENNKLTNIISMSIPFILFFNNRNRNSSILRHRSSPNIPKQKILVLKNIGTLKDTSFNVREYPIHTIPNNRVIEL